MPLHKIQLTSCLSKPCLFPFSFAPPPTTPLSCPSLLPSLLLYQLRLTSRLSHAHLSFHLSFSINCGSPHTSLMPISPSPSLTWILNFDEDNIYGDDSRMPLENKEAILTLYFAPPIGDEN